MCLVSKDYFSVPKQLLCCSTTSAFTISVPLGMRSVIGWLDCIWIIWIFFFFLYLENIMHALKTDYSHSFSSGTFIRVLAVRSCCYLSWRSSAFCWWFSRSDNWGSQLFRVILLLKFYRWFTINLWYFLVFSQTRSCLCNLVSDYIISFLFRLGAVMCMGVTAGAYILTLFAVCTLLEFCNQYVLKQFLLFGPLIKVSCYSWSIGNVSLVWFLCPLYAKHHLGVNGFIIRYFCHALLLFLQVNMLKFQCYI